jgi:hypothetical protein
MPRSREPSIDAPLPTTRSALRSPAPAAQSRRSITSTPPAASTPYICNHKISSSSFNEKGNGWSSSLSAHVHLLSDMSSDKHSTSSFPGAQHEYVSSKSSRAESPYKKKKKKGPQMMSRYFVEHMKAAACNCRRTVRFSPYEFKFPSASAVIRIG